MDIWDIIDFVNIQCSVQCPMVSVLMMSPHCNPAFLVTGPEDTWADKTPTR